MCNINFPSQCFRRNVHFCVFVGVFFNILMLDLTSHLAGHNEPLSTNDSHYLFCNTQRFQCLQLLENADEMLVADYCIGLHMF